jgi:hypothetical protein
MQKRTEHTNVEKSMETDNKKTKKTLREFYDGLPKMIQPRTELARRLAYRCGVSEQAARNWMHFGMKPRNEQHLKVLSEETGIPMEDLYR